MTEFAEVSADSIDDLIAWLNQRRKTNPVASLAELLGGQIVDRDAVLDLACIDLMHQHRNGLPVLAENYLQDFPQLDRSSDLLDLVDAELCVLAEMRKPIDLASYRSRFPDLVSDIEELAQLDFSREVSVFTREPEAGRRLIQSDKSSQLSGAYPTMGNVGSDSSGFSLMSSGNPTAKVSSAHRKLSLEEVKDEYPLEIPDWFLVDECISRDKDQCLLRGRDSVRGISIAMKIICVPQLAEDRYVTALLDVCEAASRVQNPHWIAPQMAAVQMGYLGVIRPWQFASPWQLRSMMGAAAGLESNQTGHASSHEGVVSTHRNHQIESKGAGGNEQIVSRRWRQLANVAFAIESAHQSGATHGAIHAGNLAVDHEDNIRILDAASSLSALHRWLGNRTAGIQSFDERIHLDVQDMMKLVHATARWLPSVDCDQLVNQVQEAVGKQTDSPLIRMGEILIHYADRCQSAGWRGGSKQPPRWRTRIADWLSRKL